MSGSFFNTLIAMRIVLLRHGTPDFAAHWLKPTNGFRRALDRYAASRVTVEPPIELHEFSLMVDICVTSKLARTIDSAQLLGFNDSIALKLFNESELPHPNRLFIPLSWNLFLLVYRLLWFFGFHQNCAGRVKDCKRARAGCKYLSDLAMDNESVLLVGHGIMNRLLCSGLQKSGWSIDSKSGSGYWSTITLSCQMPESKLSN